MRRCSFITAMIRLKHSSSDGHWKYMIPLRVRWISGIILLNNDESPIILRSV
jgi:hypothetical protein